MEMRRINAPEAPQPIGCYSQAAEIEGHKRLLFVSGQIPTDADGSVPEGFEAQHGLIWKNIEAQLKAADMTLDNVVKVNAFLSGRKFAMEFRKLRQAVLAGREPALTCFITGIFDATWLLEIEVIAAA